MRTARAGRSAGGRSGCSSCRRHGPARRADGVKRMLSPRGAAKGMIAQVRAEMKQRPRRRLQRQNMNVSSCSSNGETCITVLPAPRKAQDQRKRHLRQPSTRLRKASVRRAEHRARIHNGERSAIKTLTNGLTFHSGHTSSKSHRFGCRGRVLWWEKKKARARREPLRDWSGRQDLNLRPPVPQTDALPSCATARRVDGRY